MKKIIGIIFISLMFVNIGFAEIKSIEGQLIKSKGYSFYMQTLCVDGYKFVAIAGEGKGMVQVYEAGNNQSPIPAKC